MDTVPPDDSTHSVEGHLVSLEAERAKRAAEPAALAVAEKPWKRAPQLVQAILARAADPWVSLVLGGDELARVRVGATVVIIGGSGSGKSSLALCLAVEHGERVGPAIVLSIELPDDEAGARVVGQKCDASWEDALTGRVPQSDMERALACERLYFLARRHATLKNLEAAIDAARAEYPGQPIMVVVDYAQLLDSAKKEERQKVADVFAQIDDVAREKKVAVIALSQMSRHSARTARSGEAIGAESADLGAESAAIERWATMTLSIGKATEREDGSASVELSVGKARMGKGDRVFPMNYLGRSGVWRVAGDSMKAEEVREKRVTEKSAKEDRTLELAIVANVDKSPRPMSRREAKDGITGKASRKSSAVMRLIQSGDLVEVNVRATKGSKKGDWLVWTARAAQAAGVPTVAQITNGLFAGAPDGGDE